MFGAVDSAATSHFLPTNYTGTNPQPVVTGIEVQCANDTYMTSSATDELALSKLLREARSCDKFTEITIPLISVYRLCRAGLVVTFHSKQVKITDARGKTVLLGELDLYTNLYMVSLYDEVVLNAPTEGPITTQQQAPTTHYSAHSAYTVQAVPTLIKKFFEWRCCVRPQETSTIKGL